jgi:hypothetical protein
MSRESKGLVLLQDKLPDLLDLIRSGYTENKACAELQIPERLYYTMVIMDQNLADQIEKAKELRADVWISKIIAGVDDQISKDDAPGEKLRFEKLKYLARVDNPNKYGEKSSVQVDVQHSISAALKTMTIADAKKILDEEDPYAAPIEAEIVEKDDNPL